MPYVAHVEIGKRKLMAGATAIIDRTDAFLLVALMLTVLYFKSPWSLRSGGMWISDRIHIYILLALLPFFSFNLHRLVDYAFSGILIVLSLWHLGYYVQTYYLMDRDAKEALSSAEMIEPNTVLGKRVRVRGVGHLILLIGTSNTFFHLSI